jgi:hypothetical protein
MRHKNMCLQCNKLKFCLLSQSQSNCHLSLIQIKPFKFVFFCVEGQREATAMF